MPSPQNIAVKLAQIAMIGLVTYVCAVAALWGIADYYATDANARLKAWRASETFSIETLEKAVADMRFAVALSPEKPDYRDQLAQLLLYRYLYDSREVVAIEAKQHLMAARSVRPAWPRHWATTIDLKNATGEVDKELETAIVTAVELSPWDASVIQSVTRVGVSHYAQFDSDTQQLINDTVRNGLLSRVPRLADEVGSLIRESYRGWTTEFVIATIKVLVEEDWNNPGVMTDLSLLWWPLLNANQRTQLLVKISEALTTNRRWQVQQVLIQSGRLAQVCPGLPRNVLAAQCRAAFD